MARLCRIHLTGLGLAAARFNPLTIDLRDPKAGEAQDSVLWLRNGGGKTTLIALLYSTLVPDKRHFLGKLLGKDSGLADFVRNNDLGVVMTEWEFPGQMGAARRIVGQAIKCMDGETTRKFFSFVTTADYGFDQVPVLGLKVGHPAKTMDELLERLRKAADLASGKLDLVIPLDQKEWGDHLEKVGLDQELFEAHLKMNKQEGGAAELFKLKSADDFLRLFLNLIVDEESTAEEEKSLEALRAKVLQTPDRESAVAFGKEVLEGLERFAVESKTVAAKRQEELAVKIDTGRIARSIEDRIAQFSAQQQVETNKIETAETERAAHRRQRDVFVRHANGYRRRSQLLRIEEAKAALDAANRNRELADHRAEVMEAAVPWVKAVRCQAEKQTCEKALEAAREEHRPAFEAVRALGATTAAAWETMASAAKQRADAASQLAKEAKGESKKLQNQREQVTGSISTAKAKNEEADRKLEERKSARERLRSKGTLTLEEHPEAGLQRWTSERGGVQAQRRKAAGDKLEAHTQLDATQTALRTTRTSNEAKGRDLERLRSEIRQAEQEQTAIAKLQCVLDLCAGKPGDPRSEILLRNLEDQRENTQNLLVRHQIEALEDARTERSLAHKGLAAPSQDLELASEWLEKQGVKGAMPAYEWLAEHHSEEEARQMLAHAPAIWSGILIQIPAEWEKLSGMDLRLPIKAPVAISRAGVEQSSHAAADCKTILPEDGAMFCKAEAETMRMALQQRRGDQSAKQGELKDRLTNLSDAIASLKNFNQKWPQERWHQLQREEQNAAGAKTQLETDVQNLQTKEQALQTQIRTLAQMDAELAQKEAAADNHISQLETFLAEHEAKAQRWLEQYKESQRLAEAGELQLTRLRTEIQDLEAKEDTARNTEIEAKRSQTKCLTRRDQLPNEYLGPRPVDMGVVDPETAETEFRAALAAYEGKIQKGALSGRIEEMERNRQAYLEEVRRRRGKATDEEIELAATAPDIETARQESLAEKTQASAAVTNASQEHDAANQERPRALGHNEGSAISDEDYGPKNTSAECRTLVEQLEERIKAEKTEEDNARARSEAAELASTNLGHRGKLYGSMLSRLDGILPEAQGHPGFSDNDEENETLVTELCRRGKNLRKEIDLHLGRMHDLFDKKIQEALHNSRYEHRKIEFRDRLLRLNFDDLRADTDEHVAAIKTQVAVAQNQLDSLNEEKDLVVSQIEHLASRARSWCEQASKVSTMKSNMGAWANLPFLDIHIARRPDAVERRALLSRRVDEWFGTEANIPKGAELVFGCLQALGGNRPPTIKILKPQWERDGTQHDITSLAKFSDGERLTTAILLYCVLVRLRARHRGKDSANWGKDAGMLLLDNPFGKATLAELVNLQVQTAREMGVQLIYATGINDFAALKHFGHIVRLRNSSRSRSTGDFHVTHDDKPIEAAVVGYRPATA